LPPSERDAPPLPPSPPAFRDLRGLGAGEESEIPRAAVGSLRPLRLGCVSICTFVLVKLRHYVHFCFCTALTLCGPCALASVVSVFQKRRLQSALHYRPYFRLFFAPHAPPVFRPPPPRLTLSLLLLLTQELRQYLYFCTGKAGKFSPVGPASHGSAGYRMNSTYFYFLYVQKYKY
jgi:hypothetical protein